VKPDYILLRLGELTLKGRNRNQFENRMMNQIRQKLRAFPKLKLEKTYGRFTIKLNDEPYEEVIEELKMIFGLHSFSPVIKTKLVLEEIQEVALRVMQQLDPQPKTFKVVAKRAFKEFPHNSQELLQLVGGYVLPKLPELKVDVHQPEVQLTVEVRHEGAYIFSESVPGLGGFPVGSNGHALLMLSGGIDSPVAGWLSMKRGLRVDAVHFHSYPFTSEQAQQKVIDLTRKLSAYTKEIHLHMVPFTEIQTRLRQEGRENLLITFMRRAMFRITEMMAEEKGAKAIITGESLGQVASQTLSSLNAIESVVTMPILRPLITMDKNEIIRIAEKIDTFELSILPFEDCCTIFVPKSPATNPSVPVLKYSEEKMTWLQEEMEKAVRDTETLVIKADQPVNQAVDDLF
jgi:thiamine biosynthesis protein ThiI